MNWKKLFQCPKGDGLVVQPLFGATKVPGSNLLESKWKPHSVLYPILLCSQKKKKKQKVGPPKKKLVQLLVNVIQGMNTKNFAFEN
jgi:hypothetical protein